MEYESFMELCYDHLCSTSLGIARDEDDGDFGQDRDASGQDQDHSSSPTAPSKSVASSSSAGVCGACASDSSDADAVRGTGTHSISTLPSGEAHNHSTGGSDQLQLQRDGAASSQQHQPLMQTGLQELNKAIANMGVA